MQFDIVADANIPLVREAFGSAGRVREIRAEAIGPEVCSGADVLLVRSVTRINKQLLAGSRVRFVGSATAGIEHIDTSFLASRNIGFAHAPGSNAGSVVEYVLAALVDLACRFERPLRGLTLGIVGCGHIGGQLSRRARCLDMKVLKNDPPRQARGESGFVTLAQVLAESDVVSLHVPLNEETHHLINATTLAQLRQEAWLINTSRGAVVDTCALKAMLQEGSQLEAVVLDVWEHEPEVDVELLSRVTLGTPHIAGYSFDGKIRGTLMLYDAVTKHLGVQGSWDYAKVLQPDTPDPLKVSAPASPRRQWLKELVHKVYDLEADDTRMKQMLGVGPADRAAYFRRLRKTYPRRRAFETYTVGHVPSQLQRAVVKGLGIRTTEDAAQ